MIQTCRKTMPKMAPILFYNSPFTKVCMKIHFGPYNHIKMFACISNRVLY